MIFITPTMSPQELTAGLAGLAGLKNSPFSRSSPFSRFSRSFRSSPGEGLAEDLAEAGAGKKISSGKV